MLSKCRVPHATTDLMMARVRITQGWPRLISPAGSLYCLSGTEDLTPPRLVPTGRQILSKVLNLKDSLLKSTFGKWRLLARSLGCEFVANATTVCCWRDVDDLVCKGANAMLGEEARAYGFYSRSHVAYHLFDSFQKREFRLVQQIEWSNLTVAPLYRRALGLTSE